MHSSSDIEMFTLIIQSFTDMEINVLCSLFVNNAMCRSYANYTTFLPVCIFHPTKQLSLVTFVGGPHKTITNSLL